MLLVFSAHRRKNSAPAVARLATLAKAKNPTLSFVKKVLQLPRQQQRYFVDYFEAQTGLPDLTRISSHIEQTILSSLKQAEKTTRTRVIYCGYNSTCSVGQNLALPGSDIDGLTIILDNASAEQCEAFKQKLVRHSNRLLVHFSHPFAMPVVLSHHSLKSFLTSPQEILSYPLIERAIASNTIEVLHYGKHLLPNPELQEKAAALSATPIFHIFNAPEKEKYTARRTWAKNYSKMPLNHKLAFIQQLIVQAATGKPSKPLKPYFENQPHEMEAVFKALKFLGLINEPSPPR